jgi:hypothetical protein
VGCIEHPLEMNAHHAADGTGLCQLKYIGVMSVITILQVTPRLRWVVDRSSRHHEEPIVILTNHVAIELEVWAI